MRIAFLSARNFDDVSSSPHYYMFRQLTRFAIVEHMIKWRAEVSYNDPYIPALRPVRKYNFDLASTPLSEKILSTADCVLVATDHDSYDYDFILKHAHLIVDTRNVYPDRKAWGHKIYPA